jgi:hypothetical protein
VKRESVYTADIPAEPEGLEIVIDKDGDVWQRYPDLGFGTSGWRCTTSKVTSGFLTSNSATWQYLLINFGPVKPIKWSD